MTLPLPPVLDYVYRIPAAGEVPAGLILVHNRARPRRRLGSNGFRAWLQTPDDRFAPCDCGWAPEAGPHHAQRQPLTDPESLIVAPEQRP